MAKKKKDDFFGSIFDVTDNMNASVLDDGIMGDTTTFINTGSYSFNALLGGSLYGGAPGNKTIVLAGDPATGKTFLLLAIVKQFLEQNPKGAVFYFESEFALTKDMIVSRGVDPKRFYFLPVSTLQEFKQQAHKVLDKYMETPEADRPPLMMCLDSLGMLSSNKEIEDSVEGKDVVDMTKARLSKSIVRTLTPKLGRANVPLFITNHVYDVIGAYVPTKKMGGGSGPMYSASTVIFLSKSKVRDKETKSVTGNVIKCTAQKSRFTRENAQCEILLDYATGLDKYYGLLEIGRSQGVITKEGNHTLLPDGTKAFESQILKNPEKYFTDDVMHALELAARAEFSYGSDAPVETIDEEVED